MDYERALLLMNIIHKSIGIEGAAALATSARLELLAMVAPAPVQEDQLALDLSGKPAESSPRAIPSESVERRM